MSHLLLNHLEIIELLELSDVVVEVDGWVCLWKVGGLGISSGHAGCA